MTQADDNKPQPKPQPVAPQVGGLPPEVEVLGDDDLDTVAGGRSGSVGG